MSKTKTTPETENERVSSDDLSTEALTSAVKPKTLAEQAALSMRPPVMFLKQPGTDEFGHPIIKAPATITIEKDGKQLEVNEKQFTAFYSHKGYTKVQDKAAGKAAATDSKTDKDETGK